MAQLHNALRQARQLLAGIGRTVGMNEAEGGVERLGETLTPIVHPWALPEWAYLRSEKLAGVRRLVAAGGAATFSGCAIANTIGTPNLIVVVETCTALGVAAGGAALDIYTALDADIQAAFGSSQVAPLRDSRWPTFATAVSGTVVRYGTPAAVPTARQLEATLFAAANTMARSETALPVVLHPGHAVFAILRSANIGIEFNWSWRERSAFRGELS